MKYFRILRVPCVETRNDMAANNPQVKENFARPNAVRWNQGIKT